MTVCGCTVTALLTGCQVTSRPRDRFARYSKWPDTFRTALVYGKMFLFFFFLRALQNTYVQCVGSTQNFWMFNPVAGAITSGLWRAVREMQCVLFAFELNFFSHLFCLKAFRFKKKFWLKYSALINSRHFSRHFWTILPTYLECCTFLRATCTASKTAKMYPNGIQAYEFTIASRRTSCSLQFLRAGIHVFYNCFPQEFT